MACASLILRATELDIVAHPIAGYSPGKVKEILHIPQEYQVVILINVGKKSERINPLLSEKHVAWEKERPARKTLEEFIYINDYGHTTQQ